MTTPPAVELVRGRVVLEDRIIEDGYVEVSGSRIVTVGASRDHPRWPDLPRPMGTVVPGLVDLHCHGGGGAAVPTGEPAETAAVAAHHRVHGTTSLVLSTMTDTPERMIRAVSAAADVVERGEATAIHLEGPFLSAKRCGAQDPRHLRHPDPALAADLVAAGRGHVRVMTFAPELPGSDGLLEVLERNGAVGAVGHTVADVGMAARAMSDPRVGVVTHLFNGMPGLHHRDPGPVAASLTAARRGEVCVELVADGVHLAPETVAMVFALVGPSQVALVTDAMAAAGMPDGDYVLGPQRVTVHGRVARLAGSGERSIAGGTSRLWEVVRHCVQQAGVDLLAAVTAASATPAGVLRLGDEVGSLSRGRRADLLLVDDDLALRRVMSGGSWLS